MHIQFGCNVTWFCFCFDFVHMHGAVVVLYFVGGCVYGGRGSLKIGRSRSRWWKMSDVDRQGDLKIRQFLRTLYVSSLISRVQKANVDYCKWYITHTAQLMINYFQLIMTFQFIRGSWISSLLKSALSVLLKPFKSIKNKKSLKRLNSKFMSNYFKMIFFFHMT